ncbi:MAG: hypothetical protein HY858_08495 [Candidatus Solibacter usitatus]|nr:hypothetical protein [Candidatus Solibacter usitatus]
MATDRQYLHELIDKMSEADLARAKQSLAPFDLSAYLGSLPVDDEEYGPETIASLLEAQAQADRGEVVSHEEILKEFGLK